MIDRLMAHFRLFGTVTIDEAALIEQTSVIKHYKKGDYLLKEGQQAQTTYFLFEGLVRQFQWVNGEEKTFAFFVENDWVLALGSSGEEVAHFNWICQEDCVILVGNEEGAQAIFKLYPHLEIIARKVVENSFAIFQNRVNNYLSDNPEQRYLRILQDTPSLLQRVPQYHLASYIGVKAESLSRIKKRLALKKA